MKKTLALLLCLAMVAVSLAGCGSNGDEEKGAVIPIYISDQALNFDPALAYTDDSSAKLIELLYQGLFDINENGKRVKSLAKSTKIVEDPENDYYMLEITLKDSAWSDGRAVQAGDFVYALKRIIEPEFHGEAASMLYDIKNARAVKAGDASIDDIGIYDVGTNILQFEFETSIDYEQFMDYLASPCFSPLREDAVTKVDSDWSTNISIIMNNGPFCVRSYNTTGEKKLILERNQYYYRNVENDSLKKYVTPFRLVINYDLSDEELMQAYEDGKIVYVDDIPLEKRADYAKKAKTNDTQSGFSFMFNTTNELFKSAEVRRALSMALDREAIAEKLVFAEAAKAYITSGVYENDSPGKSFRKKGGDLIATTANIEEAKSLLRSAGVTRGEFTITVRKDRDVDMWIAEYAADVWKDLGFTVNIEEISSKSYIENDYDLVRDRYFEAYESGDFDVIAIDYQMLSVDAFPTLAQYALNYSGGAMDLTSENFEMVPHNTGYNSEAYNEIIERAYAEKDRKARASILHEAEALLMQDMPIVPVVVYENAYLKNSDLSNIDDDYFGFRVFTKAKLKNYKDYDTTAAEG